MNKQEFKHGTIYQGDCNLVLDSIKKVDHVIQDLPYGYLKHRIETNVDYKTLFTKIREKISPKGAIITFGRGDLFYEWNLYLRDLGFIHKEDCTLYKNSCSNATNKISRYGESFTIRGLKGFSLKEVRIPIYDFENVSDSTIANALRKVASEKKHKEIILDVLNGVRNKNTLGYTNTTNHPIQNGKMDKKNISSVSLLKLLTEGKKMGNVLHSSYEVISEGSHPTVKPSKEISYLVQAISNENDIILDPTCGSGSIPIAVLKAIQNDGIQRRFIGIELDNEYFDLTCRRIENYYLTDMFL